MLTAPPQRDSPWWRGFLYGSNNVETLEFQEYMATNPSAHAYYKDIIMPELQAGRLHCRSMHFEIICGLSLCGGVYVSEPREGDIYIEDWNVSSPELLHRHLEFGHVRTAWNIGIVEIDTTDGKCDLCHKRISGELSMIHKFHQL
jgi:hypothetical protein